MSKKLEDEVFDRAFKHAQMMQIDAKRARAMSKQTSREFEFEQRLFAAQEKMNYERELAEQHESEVRESNQLLINMVMRSLGVIAVAVFLYMVFIKIAGAK